MTFYKQKFYKLTPGETRTRNLQIRSLSPYPIGPRGLCVYVVNSTPTGFEPARAEPNGLAVHHLNHSAIASKKHATTAGFEPTRAEPNRFQVCLLNHSDKSS